MSKVFNSIRKNFTITPNLLIEDNSISIQARFVFIYMASRPDDWDFYMGSMKKSLNLSEETIRKYINELCKRGWIDKLGQKNEGGNYGAVSYVLNSEPKAIDKDITEDEFFGDGNIPLHNNIEDKKNVSNIYMSDFAKMQNKEERIAKAFHSLFERDNEVWRKASLEKWVGDLKKLMTKLKQKETSLVAIYTEIAMQKVQLYKCRSFHYETYFSIESLGKKQKNGEYVYESILALARKMHDTNQKWIEEYNKNIKKFESWN
jgi:alkylhydroperoxidase/carboxymuconolactone decarboxylase family protein YurZ